LGNSLTNLADMAEPLPQAKKKLLMRKNKQFWKPAKKNQQGKYVISPRVPI
jgi:hypothetical protein